MDVERTIEIILNNLTSVTAKQEKAETEIQALRKLVRTGMKMLVQVQEAQLQTDKKMAELAEAQKRTDEKFQRWLDSRNGSNGHGKKPR
jgi:hypothetical protein